MASERAVQRDWIIAIAAGLVSALMFLSMLTGNLFSLLLVYLAPLPLVLMGLGWGPAVSSMAAIAGTLILAIAVNLSIAAIFGLFYAAPLVFLTRIALRHAGEDEAKAENVQAWYPAGRILTWIVGIALALFLAVQLGLTAPYGGLVPVIEAQLEEMVPNPEVFLSQFREAGADMTKDEFFGLMARTIPGIVALFWCAVMVLNLTLGQTIVKLSGRNLRPDFDWLQVDLPFGLALALAAAMVAAFLPAGIGFIGGTAAVILAAPYFLTGLITAHSVSAGWVARSDMPGVTGGLRMVALAFLYLLLLAPQGIGAQLISLLGILDQWFSLRRRFAADPAAGTA
ncbi:MAG: hypothetical protein ACFB6R_08495 [Alphaproteobacteria bacterium]